MKQIVKTAQFLLLSAVLFCAWGCMSDFDAINRNPSEATDEELGRENYKISTNLRGLQNWVVPVQEHRYQFNESLTGNPYAGYMAETPDGWKEKFSTFNPSADWLKWPFVIVMGLGPPMDGFRKLNLVRRCLAFSRNQTCSLSRN